jgi:hypothetical protein
MSTTTKSKVPSKPDQSPVASIRYADDYYGWVEQQVALLRSGRLTEVDAENVAEELSDVGRTEYRELESALRVLMLHLLKWDYQPTHRSRSWVRSIDVQRRRATRVLQDNPSLKRRVPEATRDAYGDARREAAYETGLTNKLFPIECPYDWPAITTRFVEFDDQRSPDED